MNENEMILPELDQIPLGSADAYFVEAKSNNIADIPSDEEIETEDNLLGRTKDGATVTYEPTYYEVESDDGNASRDELTKEIVRISLGLCTLNKNGIDKLVATAVTTVVNGRVRTEIGGIKNNNNKLYIVRLIHRDKVCGDIRYTILGRNLNGFAKAYKKDQETVVTPDIKARPFSNGRLLIIERDRKTTDTQSETET